MTEILLSEAAIFQWIISFPKIEIINLDSFRTDCYYEEIIRPFNQQLTLGQNDSLIRLFSHNMAPLITFLPFVLWSKFFRHKNTIISTSCEVNGTKQMLLLSMIKLTYKHN